MIEEPIIIENKMNLSSLICFWCGTNRGGESVLYGANDEPLPEHMFTDYEPCVRCKQNMDENNTIIEVETEPNGNPEIKDGFYPTGRWFLVSNEKITQIFSEEICKQTTMFMIEPDVWDKLFNRKPEGEEQC